MKSIEDPFDSNTIRIFQGMIMSKTLNVTLYPQLTNMWCWAASGEMAMSFLGHGVSQCDQANFLFNRNDCCISPTPGACVNGGWPNFPHWGFTVDTTSWGTALTFAQLKTQIDTDMPVAFAWGWTGGGGHMMVARGYKDDVGQYVYINDPWPPNQGDVRYITYSFYVSSSNHVHWRDYYNLDYTQSITGGTGMVKGQEIEPAKTFKDAKAAAADGINLLKTMVTGENYESMGFSKPLDEKVQLELDEPFHVFYVHHDALKKHVHGFSAQKLLVNHNELRYPILINNEVVSSIVVSCENSGWVVQSLGDSNIIKDLAEVRDVHAKKSGIHHTKYFIAHIPSLYHMFIAHEDEDNNLMFTHVHDNDKYDFVKHGTQPAAEVIEAIQPDAIADLHPLV